MLLACDYQVTTDDDPMVRPAEEAIEGFALTSEPNAFTVNSFLSWETSFLCPLSRN